MAAVWYATLEEVKAALDSAESARNNGQLSRLIAAATSSIECDLLHRVFYPQVGSRLLDWPTRVEPDGSRILALGANELIYLDSLEINDTPVTPDHYRLLPVDGPPYTAIELDETVTLTGSPRRAVEAVGTLGHSDRQAPAGMLAAGVVDDSVATVTVSDSAAIGTGQLLLVDAERMIVDRRSMVDTGQNLAADLASNPAIRVVPVTDGSVFVEGEVVMVDAEKMLITEIAGDNLIVQRAWDGSALAAHTTGADVFAPRSLTVRRGVLGTTAVAHGAAAAITKLVVPGLVNQLCIAETLTARAQESSGYGRKIGSDDADMPAAGAGIEDLRRRAWEAYGRRKYGPSTWNADDGV